MDSPLPPDAEFYRRLGFRPDGIADLSALGLSPEAIVARQNFIGGSDAKVIVSDDAKAICDLADFKRGLKPSKDLSGEIHVQLGSWTEPFILAWAERELGTPFTRRGERHYARSQPFMAATLDAYVEDFRGTGPRVVQAKHVNAWSQIGDVLEAYRPQVTHESHCLGAEGALLVVLIGTSKLEILDVELDLPYLTDLVERETRFWEAVKAGVDPVPRPIKLPAARVAHAPRVGEVDMAPSNAWADAAARWLESAAASREHTKAAEDLKALVPKTAQKAMGHGVRASVSKANAITLKPIIDDAAASDEAKDAA